MTNKNARPMWVIMADESIYVARDTGYLLFRNLRESDPERWTVERSNFQELRKSLDAAYSILIIFWVQNGINVWKRVSLCIINTCLR
ncbi:Uncharacterised protein [Legionella pneumophila]|nr:Uncharacterised protein [Legionella pneumophila]